MTPSGNHWKPKPDDHYSKNQVNRAGDAIREWWTLDDYPDYADADDRHRELADRVVKARYIIEWWRAEHAQPLSKAAVGLRYHVFKETGQKPEVSQRLKRIPTMIDKLNRESGMQLARMGDIGGCRAQLPSLEAVRDVSRRLKKNWKVKKVQDYIENPKDSGYRAYHLIVEKEGRLIEIQLRTELQDRWANQVEKDGRLGAQGYKFGRGDERVHRYYRAVAVVFALMDADSEVTPEARQELNVSYDELQKFNSTPKEK